MVHLSTPREERMKLFMPSITLDKESDVVGYGDIHGAHMDNFQGKTIFNVGSVGNPLEIPSHHMPLWKGNMIPKNNLHFNIFS